MNPHEFLDVCLYVGLILVGFSILLGLVRMRLGPTLADRVIALDMMTAAVVGFCAIYAISADTDAFLDVAIALALVSFLSVIALARYAERLIRKSDVDD